MSSKTRATNRCAQRQKKSSFDGFYVTIEFIPYLPDLSSFLIYFKLTLNIPLFCSHYQENL